MASTRILKINGVTPQAPPRRAPQGERGRRGISGTGGTGGTTTTSPVEGIGAQWQSAQAISITYAQPVDRYMPKACTIKSVTVLGDTTGSCVIDIKKGAYASFPPTISICAAALPTISSGIKYQDSTMTGWTTAVSAGDVLRFVINSTSSFKRIAIFLEIA